MAATEGITSTPSIKQKIMQSSLFELLGVALRVDLQWTYCYLKTINVCMD